jgi:hypothetical protein
MQLISGRFGVTVSGMEAPTAWRAENQVTVPSASKTFGIAVNTLRDWLDHRDLRCEVVDGVSLVRPVEICTFILKHQGLPGARRALGRVAAGQVDADRSTPSSLAITSNEAASARAAADALFEALLEGARAAEHTASSHREQLEALHRAFTAQDNGRVMALPDDVSGLMQPS